jgi:hypothetical protein
MAVIPNTTTADAVNTALSELAVKQFTGDFDRLSAILGITGVETVQAGHQLEQIEYTGTLAAGAYVEGDEVPLTKITATKKPIGKIDLKPYRRVTTAQAVLASGMDVAVLGTDRKVMSLVRNGVVGDFISSVKAGTGAVEGKNLQAAIAAAIGKLNASMEGNGDATSQVIVIANTEDIYAYLGDAPITTQTLFGMTYIADFLGLGGLFATSKVDKGAVYVTAAENIKAYGVDMAGLNAAGFPYLSDENGLIGVAHVPALDRVSVESDFIAGARFVAEVTNYIVKGTIKVK